MKAFITKIKIEAIFILLITIVISISCKKDSNNENPVDPGPIPETTKIIDHSTWQDKLVSIDSTNFTFIFKSDLLNKLELKAGDILVSGEGYGYLRKVTNVVQEGNSIKVYTSFASLNEAVRDGTFTLQTNLSEQKIQKITYYRQGVKIDTSHMKSTEATNIDATIDEYLDAEKKVHVTGNFSMMPALNCELQIKLFKVEKFSMEYEIGEQIKLETTLELLNLQYSKEIDLVNITFTPITIFIGPVPVIIVPELEIVAGAELNIESSVSTSIDQQMSYAIGILYENGVWSPTYEQNKSFTFQPPTLTAKANAKAYIKPQLNLKFYGALAPYLYGEAYGRIDADLLVNPWWTLYGGANVEAGVEMEIFGKEIFDWPETPFYLFEYETEITNSSNFQYNQPPVLPFDPQPQNNLQDIQTDANLSWLCTDPDGDPIKFDVYFGTSSQPPKIASDISEFSFEPGALQETTIYYWKIVAKDDHDHITPGIVWHFTTKTTATNEPPALPSNPNPTNGALAVGLPVTLSWTCSDPENDALLYDVYFGTTLNPPIGPTNQTSTNFQPSGLTTGTQYYWKIVAKDDHSNTTTGNVWSFTTEQGISLPTVITNVVTNPTQTTATGGGNVTSDGGAPVSARGVCWSTSTVPTLTDEHTTNGNGTGSFSSSLTGLTPNTQYYVRAYATNGLGTAYGEELNFSTLNVQPWTQKADFGGVEEIMLLGFQLEIKPI